MSSFSNNTSGSFGSSGTTRNVAVSGVAYGSEVEIVVDAQPYDWSYTTATITAPDGNTYTVWANRAYSSFDPNRDTRSNSITYPATSDPNGTWTFFIRDTDGESGTLYSVQVNFTPPPEGLGTEVAWWCPSLQDDSASGTITDLSVSGGYDINNTGTWISDTGSGGSTAVELNSTQNHTYTGTMPPAFASMDGGASDNGRTLAIWIKLNNFSGPRTALNIASLTGSGTSVTGYRVRGNLTGGTAQGYAEASFTTGLTDGGSTPPSTWVHIAYTIDRDVSSNSTTTRLYVDGTSVDSDTTTVPDSALNRILIGAEMNSSGSLTNFLDGRWDDARIFDSALTQTEITHLASARAVQGPPPEGLGTEVAWWCPSLRDDSADSAVTDLTGGGYDMNLVAMSSSNWVSDTSEGGTVALEFNGVDEYCQTDLNNVPYSSLDARLQTSVSAWIYGEGTSGNGSAWAYAQTTGASSTRRVGYRILDRGADQAGQCAFANNLGDTNAQVAIAAPNGSQPRSTWYHIYAEFEKSATGDNVNASCRLWIDGTYIGEDSDTTGIFDNETLNRMFLGQNTRTAGNVETTYFDGRLDDIRFFGQHLTQAEITHLASSRGVEGPPASAVEVNGLPVESASDAAFVNVVVGLRVTNSESISAAERVALSVRTANPVDTESVSDAQRVSLTLAGDVSPLDGSSVTSAERVTVTRRVGLTATDAESVTQSTTTNLQHNLGLGVLDAESVSDAEQVEIGEGLLFVIDTQSVTEAETLGSNLIITKPITVADGESATDAATLDITAPKGVAVTDAQSVSDAASVFVPIPTLVVANTESMSDAGVLQIGVNPLVDFGQGFTMSTGFFDLNGFL